MGKPTIVCLAVFIAALACLAQVAGQYTARTTLIAIEDLDCPTCAKGVEKALAAVPGVANVKTDVEKRTATITPQTTKSPSPRGIWDAIEKAGFHPTKLSGPTGTFTTKPPR